MKSEIENSDQDPLGIVQFPQFTKNVDLISTCSIPSKQGKKTKIRRGTVSLGAASKMKGKTGNTELIFSQPPPTSIPHKFEAASDSLSPRLFESVDNLLLETPTKQHHNSINDTMKNSVSIDNMLHSTPHLEFQANNGTNMYEINENSCLVDNHVVNIEPARHKKHKRFQLDVPKMDFTVLLNYNKTINSDALDCILASLNAQMIKERSDLDDYLSDTESHFLAIAEISDQLSLYSHYDVQFHREKAIREVIYEQLALKRGRRYQNVSKYNIQIIDDFISFLQQYKNGKNIPAVNIDKFLSDYLITYEDKRLNILTINRHLKCLEGQIHLLHQMNTNTNAQNQSFISKIINATPSKPITINDSLAKMKMVPPKDDQSFFLSNFLSNEQKSGRIISRFLANIQVMSYPDLDVIISAILPDQSMLTGIRNVLFDLAWAKMEYPFAHISHIQFPQIFDLTPRSFNASYLSEEQLDIPFEKLNYVKDSKNQFWPFAFTQDYYFTLMCYRNPFQIASTFWELIQNVANTLQMIAIDSGEKEDEVEIGFDNIFPILLSSLFAFGCPGILDTLEYCSQFLDYANDEHQQFAMTHCSGIVDQIRRTRADEFRRRAKSHRNSPMF